MCRVTENFHLKCISLILCVLTLLSFTSVKSRRDFNDRLFWTNMQKVLLFPKGMVLKFEPSFEAPLWGSDAISTKFSMQVPITLKVDALSVMRSFNRRTANFEIPYHVSSSHFHRTKRNLMHEEPAINEKSVSLCGYGQNDKILVLKKLETILNTAGIAGKSCILRAICEFHEFDAAQSYGILGEMIKILVSIKDHKTSCSNDYVGAEDDGRNFRCYKYSGACKQSLFSWGVNYIPHFSPRAL